MAEIVQLQDAAQRYKLEPEEQFGAWFRDMERLSETARCGHAGLGPRRGGLSLLASLEVLCVWVPGQPQPWPHGHWGT